MSTKTSHSGALEPTINGRIIRGLTLHRPWPWAFLHAGKRVENRGWKPPRWMVGGYLALHSGKRFDREAVEAMRGGRFGEAAKLVPPTADDHPHSVIEVVVRLEGWKYMQSLLECLGEGPYAFGPYLWATPDPLLLHRPVTCRGAQGLWRLPADVFEQVRAQVEDR